MLSSGNASFSEFLPIMVPQPFCDDRMTTYTHQPGLNVTVTIGKPIEFLCKPQLLNVTFESIFNVPSIMNEDMEYHVCIMLPLANLVNCYFLVKKDLIVLVLSSGKRTPAN